MINGPRPQGTPTVEPIDPFYPKGDAESVHKALNGSDSFTITNILAHRTNEQRLQIAEKYKTLYGKDLGKKLRDDAPGTGLYGYLLYTMMIPLPELYAKELNGAMEGLCTDKDTLIEIICTKSNQEMRAIRDAYQSLYHVPLEDDFADYTSGAFQNLMVSLCQARRDESMITDLEAAKADAQTLMNTDVNNFVTILCQRNWSQLQLIFQEFQRAAGHDIEIEIKRKFSWSIKRGLLAVTRSMKNQPALFARLLKKRMRIWNPQFRAIARLVLTRSEIDMVEIKGHYLELYDKFLSDAIVRATDQQRPGYYRECLLHLIGYFLYQPFM